MFVSSYNTYINADSSIKAQRNRLQESKQPKNSFETKLLSKTIKNIDVSTSFPINYISNYKALNNQQKLQNNFENIEKNSFIKLEAQSSANKAYTDNSKIFSLINKPHMTLDQTPAIDKKLPINTQHIKEENLRHTMINTYVSNENYYKITA